MRFGKELTSGARPEWAEHYVDYSLLKKLIKDVREAQAAAGQGPELGRLLDARKAIFQGQLDAEVLKALAFFRRQSAALLQAVDGAAAAVDAATAEEEEEGEEHPPEAPRPRGGSLERAAELERLAGEVQRLSGQATRLLQYVHLNLTAIRKILKKFAKNVQGATNEPVPGFLTLEIEHPDDPSWRVLQGTYLPSEVAADLADMQQHPALRAAAQRLQGLAGQVCDARARLVRHASVTLPSAGEEALGAVAGQMEAMLEAEQEAEAAAALVHAVPWAERAAGMFEPPPPDQFAYATLAGLALNNLSTGLFMMNYTAVLPPVDALCARLGVPSSHAGLIMAASDLAALFASVAISYWTQRSFRQPLLFSAAACFAGNLLFVASYSRRSLPALLGARLLNGLGSARAANRRYTADYVGRARRTAASAAFVGASNLGMALGPLLSLPLAALPERRLPGGLPLDPVTAVGWVMAACWAAFFGAALALFPEPPKRLPIGLARESTLLAAAAADGSSSALGAAGSLGARRGGAPSGSAAVGPQRERSQLRQPLLGPAASSVPAAGAAMEGGRSAAEAAVVAELAPAGAEPLLPHAARAEQQEAELHKDRRAERRAAAAWRATLPGTAACTLALLVQKMVQQGWMDGLPVFTDLLYGWRAKQAGLFLGLASLAMVPVNAAVGAASARLSDRSLALGSLGACAACLAALAAAGASSAPVYFGAGVSLLTATVVLEGVATSLMSKCIWQGFAQGVLNAGLLSTEAGTLGRFAGNGFLTLAGKLTGLASLAQLAAFSRLLHAGLAGACAALLALLACLYGRLKG